MIKKPKTKGERFGRPFIFIGILLVSYISIFSRLLVIVNSDHDAHLSFMDSMQRFNNNTTNGTVAPLEFSTNFIFPSWQQRVKYYMGDWCITKHLIVFPAMR
mmetsp:Transcript_5577/g.12147  ORF Transcript_5577/g.12147 Transcript_5577/m.12147 type:complete len:102 (-) Transcript_5577:1067-1372(-)